MHRQNVAERRLMAETIGVLDEDLLKELQAAGYRADTIVLAELAPHVQVAWADGSVSGRERALMFEAAAHRGVLPYSPARAQLHRWLGQRPSDHFFRTSRQAIRRMLGRLPAHIRIHVRRTLIQECTAVATASGGVLGWGTVSEAERRVIDAFRAELDTDEPAGIPGY